MDICTQYARNLAVQHQVAINTTLLLSHILPDALLYTYSLFHSSFWLKYTEFYAPLATQAHHLRRDLPAWGLARLRYFLSPAGRVCLNPNTGALRHSRWHTYDSLPPKVLCNLTLRSKQSAVCYYFERTARQCQHDKALFKHGAGTISRQDGQILRLISQRQLTGESCAQDGKPESLPFNATCMRTTKVRTNYKPCPRFTKTGLNKLTVPPVPSWPSLFSPQHITRPPTRSAQECPVPATTAEAMLSVSWRHSKQNTWKNYLKI